MPKAKYSRDSKARQKGHQLAPSKMSQKQLMTRFGKKGKKGELAETANYVTRTQAVKRLQISLRDFRRLCILKGIYPRAPPKMPAGSSHRQTYYHVKDVGFLAHEPVLHKFRELKSFMKKVRRAAGKDELTEARHLAANRPVYRIDHLIRERYPRFLDALADIDDALCMVHLFATLPADKPIEAERVHTATRLVREWQHITVRARSLRKAFISVKGYYFQASFHGVPVTWTMPHRFSVPMPNDVDYRILLTFLELYEVQLKFVLFKLYNDHGLAYPPVLDEGADMAGVMLGAVRSARLDRGAMAAAAASHNAVADEQAEDASEGSDVESDDEDADTEVEGQGTAKRARAADTSDSAEAREAAVTAAARRGMGAVLREAARSGGVEGKAGLRVMAGASVDGEAEDADDDSVAGSVGSLDGDEEMEDAEAEELGRVLVPEVDGEEEDEAQAAASSERRRQAVLRERRGRRLFRGLVIFLNREVPREPFELVIRAFAGRVGWDGPGSSIEADDPRITHHVIDRITVRAPVPGREYVQPQWIFDSANNRILLPLERYRPGASLPPHLSPFIEDEKEGYVPDYRLELERLRSAVEVRDGVASGDAAPASADADEEDKAMDSDDEEEEAVAAAEALIARGFLKGAGAPEDDEDLEGDSSDEEDEEVDGEEEDEDDDDDEEEEEDKPAPAITAQSKLRAKRAKARAATEATERARQEEIEMQSMLLSNRKRKDLKLVVRGQSKQKNWVRRMEAKRDAIEEQDEAAKSTTKKAAKKPAASKKAAPAAKKASPAAKKASPAAAKKASPAAKKASPAAKRNPKRGRA